MKKALLLPFIVSPLLAALLFSAKKRRIGQGGHPQERPDVTVSVLRWEDQIAAF